MADIKWIKIVTDIFDDAKIQLIEQMPEADTIIVIWFKLLCLAGKTNNSGLIMLSDKIPYTEEMLATLFRRPLNTVRLAFDTFVRFGMVEIVDNIITIPNWEKHQNVDQLEKIKDSSRKRVARFREKQKQLTSGNVAVTLHVTQGNAIERDIDKDKDIEEEREGTGESGVERQPPTPYQEAVDLYNSICTSLPRCRTLSDARKKTIKARIRAGYTLESIEQAFTKAQASGFLRGANNRNWTANFDWLLKDANLAKVLDGNYDDKGHDTGQGYSYDYDDGGDSL